MLKSLLNAALILFMFASILFSMIMGGYVSFNKTIDAPHPPFYKKFGTQIN